VSLAGLSEFPWEHPLPELPVNGCSAKMFPSQVQNYWRNVSMPSIHIYICKKLQKSVKKNTYENLFSNIWSLMSYLSKTCLIRQQPVNLLNPAVPSFHPLARRPVVQGQLRTPPPWKWLFASGHLPNISEFASSPIYSTRIYYVLTMYVEMERTWKTS
jgi:hypothetical protein